MRRPALLLCALLSPVVQAALPAPARSFIDDTPRSLTSRNPSLPAAVATPDANGVYEIDVLALYTPTYAQRIGNVAAEVQRLNSLANTYLTNSRVPVRYRVVGVEPYSGSDESVGFYENREAMAQDGFVRSRRNELQADIAMLLRSNGGANPQGICGLASPFNNSQPSDPPEDVDPERDGFVVLGDSCGGGSGYAHELGHVLAAGHQYAPAGNTSVQTPLITVGGLGTGLGVYWKPYSHAIACVDTASGRAYVSIMFSANISLTGEDHPVNGDFFSNPDLVPDGQICGANGGPGVEPTQANNARVMTEAAPYVAAYRDAKASAVKSAESGNLLLGALGLPATLALLLLRLMRAAFVGWAKVEDRAHAERQKTMGR